MVRDGTALSNIRTRCAEINNYFKTKQKKGDSVKGLSALARDMALNSEDKSVMSGEA